MALRQIPLSSLRIGMFVTAVDRSWLRTPFLRHRFHITSAAEIQAMRQCGIATVTIDTEQGPDVVDEQPATPSPVPASEAAPTASPEQQASQPTQNGTEPPTALIMAKNLALARIRRQEWSAKVKAVFESAQSSGTIQIEAVYQLVDEILGDLLEREAACLAVLRTPQADHTLYEHSLTVCTLTLVLANETGHTKSFLRTLGLGALVHDVGLMRLPHNLLRRTNSLSVAQRKLYDSHPAQGLAVLDKSGVSDVVVRTIVEQHHQPCGPAIQNSTETAAKACRLVAIADQYDEFVTGQTGLPEMSSFQALSQLYQSHQAQPVMQELASNLIRIMGVYPLYSLVTLKSGAEGIVIGFTAGQSHAPTVCLIRDEQGRKLSPPVKAHLDSKQNPQHRVERIVDATKAGIDVVEFLRQVTE